MEIACSLSDYVNGLRTRPQFDSRESTRSKHLRPGMFNGFPRHAKTMPRSSESATKSSLITPRNLSTVSSSRRDCNPGKMIASIVLALFLFCQSINIGGCLLASEARANGTTEQISQRRMKRSLTFPDPTMLLLIFGLGTPLQLDRESIIVGIFTKMWYTMPTNATDFTEPGVYYTRASKSRWSFYKMFEKMLAIYGFGGKECLLRAICEVASVPFDVHHGLLGQLVQTFLRPSSTQEEYDEYGDREYRAAERLGEQVEGENCHTLYPECNRSILDVFSALIT